MDQLIDQLEAISPVDGRYRSYGEDLAKIFSESGLMRYRLVVEGEYLIALSETRGIGLRHFSAREKVLIRKLYKLPVGDAKIISAIEKVGYRHIKATEHDMKAVEYFMREKLKRTSLKDSLGWLHFALTSYDVSEIAYGLMLGDAIREVLTPLLCEIERALAGFARQYAGLPMLGRTHGQPATPTTFGKEMNVFRARLVRQMDQLAKFKVSVKLNGATGNYNAHVAAYPNVDWIAFTKRFIARLNRERTAILEPNLLTTQIDPHDSYAELFDILRRTNTILIGFDQDMWRYISDDWLVQKAKEGEIGSSTMPHKINPIKFENSEGNLGIANALFAHFSAKLPISRLQRDLSDSTVERNFGVALAHCAVGYSYLLNGLGRVSVHEAKVVEALEEHPEIVSEAIQIVLRREGIPMPYEKLKELTRGRQVTLDDIRAFVDSLKISDKLKKELKSFTPKNYLGLAKKLARM
ncbi:MAG: adenylosuccinate lyase [Minisyncoccia bacterium]|jgi:adenylosuccinate lyase